MDLAARALLVKAYRLERKAGAYGALGDYARAGRSLAVGGSGRSRRGGILGRYARRGASMRAQLRERNLARTRRSDPRGESDTDELRRYARAEHAAQRRAIAENDASPEARRAARVREIRTYRRLRVRNASPAERAAVRTQGPPRRAPSARTRASLAVPEALRGVVSEGVRGGPGSRGALRYLRRKPSAADRANMAAHLTPSGFVRKRRARRPTPTRHGPRGTYRSSER